MVWVDYAKLDFGKGSPETALPVEKKIFSLNGNVKIVDRKCSEMGETILVV